MILRKDFFRSLLFQQTCQFIVTGFRKNAIMNTILVTGRQKNVTIYCRLHWKLSMCISRCGRRNRSSIKTVEWGFLRGLGRAFIVYKTGTLNTVQHICLQNMSLHPPLPHPFWGGGCFATEPDQRNQIRNLQKNCHSMLWWRHYTYKTWWTTKAVPSPLYTILTLRSRLYYLRHMITSCKDDTLLLPCSRLKSEDHL